MTTDKEFVIGTRNKKGLIRKIKWLPNKVIINREEYQEYLKLKRRKEIEETIQEGIKGFKID